MKHVYPPRHPGWLDDQAKGQAQPQGGQPPAAPQQREIGRKAHGNATDGNADTDRGPVRDQVDDDKVAADRGRDEPRQ